MLPELVFTVISILGSVTCQSSFVEKDSIVFPQDNTTAQADISDKLKQCINDDFKIEFKGECHSLLTTAGVCPEGHWLVLDLNSASLPSRKIVGKCALKRCSKSKEHYWVNLKRCVNSSESVTLCPKGNVVSTDMFGDGYCKCIEKPVQAKSPSTGECYPVYKQGPCRACSVWVEVNERAECRIDNCQAVRIEYANKTVVPWSDNKCYFVGERGPCKQGHVLHIHPWHKGPECGESFQPLNLVNPPCVGTNHAGSQCTGPVKTPEQQFNNNINSQIHIKRNRKSQPS